MSHHENDLEKAEYPSDVDAALAAGAAIANPKVAGAIDAAHYVVVPDGYRVIQTPTIDAPVRPRTTAKLRDAASFVAYWKQHVTPQANVYATTTNSTFTAIFDDHLRTGQAEDLVTANTASRGNHREFRATLTLNHSPEWTTWKGNDRKKFNQLQLAEFLQDNLPDVINPSGAELLEIALNFEASQTSKFVSAHRLENGNGALQFVTENDAKGEVKLPAEILLNIPVYERGEPVAVSARLRYRIDKNAGALAIWYEMVRPHKIVDAAFGKTWDAITEGCGVTILHGTPE